MTQSGGELDLVRSNSKSVGANTVLGRGELDKGQKRRIPLKVVWTLLGIFLPHVSSLFPWKNQIDNYFSACGDLFRVWKVTITTLQLFKNTLVLT